MPLSSTILEPTGETAIRPTATQQLRRVVRRVACELTILFVLYVLSIGPMFWQWYEAHNLNGSPLLVRFYAPLQLLTRIDLFRDLINWYIELWIL